MAAIAGRSIVRHGLQAELRHRHQRAGIAGGDRASASPSLHRLDRQPHGGLAAAAAQRLARLVVHARPRPRCGGSPSRPSASGCCVEQGSMTASLPNMRKRDVRDGAPAPAPRPERPPTARDRRPSRRARSHWLRHERTCFRLSRRTGGRKIALGGVGATEFSANGERRGRLLASPSSRLYSSFRSQRGEGRCPASRSVRRSANSTPGLRG